MTLAHHRIRLGLAAVSLALLPVLGACSSDGDGKAAAPTTAGSKGSGDSDPASDPPSDPATGDTETNPLDIPDDVPLGAYASGIEVAMGADKVEVDGTTIHVYLAEDNNKVPEGTECIVIGAVLPEGATGVIHRGGSETTC
jgi:hypothetical protein